MHNDFAVSSQNCFPSQAPSLLALLPGKAPGFSCLDVVTSADAVASARGLCVQSV